MNAGWSSEQRRCLSALGYTMLRPVDAHADVQGGAATAIDHMASVSVRPAQGRAADAATDPMLRALIRAAGLDPSRIDAEQWQRVQRIPSLAQLRNNAAAKRALWPQLRALRRERDRS